jgi:hypothetical protein
MHFIGVLIDMSSGEILNANNVVNFGTGIGQLTDSQSIRIYPNPTAGKVNISGSENMDISVYSTTGNLVYSLMKGPAREIDLSNLENGLYIIQLKIADNNIISKKISIIK